MLMHVWHHGAHTSMKSGRCDAFASASARAKSFSMNAMPLADCALALAVADAAGAFATTLVALAEVAAPLSLTDGLLHAARRENEKKSAARLTPESIARVASACRHA